ncbi:MAG: AraC family transcriptional regulator [Clostridia bacterium]|nr:AraC family transcriptional regulator [Clostridia bacterium]
MHNDSFKKRYKSIPIAISENSTSYDTLPHTHGELELVLVSKGRASVNICNESFEIGAGELMLVNPYEVHSITVDTSVPYYHRCICFDPSLIMDSELCESINNGAYTLPHRIDSIHIKAMEKYFDDIYNTVLDDSPTLALEGRSYVTLMLAYMLKNGIVKKQSVKKGNSEFSREVLSYVSKNYSKNITSRQASHSLSFDQSYFCRSFKRHFGTSFSSYLNMYRIAVSKGLLEDKSKSISDVAYECGFSSPLYFTKCFKKQVGLLPSEYKKSTQ